MGRVFNTFSPFKSSETNRISAALLQKWMNIIIHSLYCIWQFDAWRTVRVVFILKPGCISYETAKDLKPISLSSFLLKALERLIERFINETKRLSSGQICL